MVDGPAARSKTKNKGGRGNQRGNDLAGGNRTPAEVQKARCGLTGLKGNGKRMNIALDAKQNGNFDRGDLPEVEPRKRFSKTVAD